MLEITVNGRPESFEDGTTLSKVRQTCKTDADITVYNGFPVKEDLVVVDGDRVALIKRGEIPSFEEMKFLIQSRNSPEIYDQIGGRTVAIAGAGGLGSAVAVALARLFVKKLIIVDFDVVEPSNLNRQQFFFDQLGMAKVAALKENLKRVNPYLEVEIHNTFVDANNIESLFAEADVIAECFDTPSSKKVLTETVLTKMKCPIVAVSGIAGHLDVEKMICRRVSDRFILIGDGITGARPDMGLMAPKVGVAAHLQASKIMEFLLELD